MPTAIERLLSSNTTIASTNYQSPPTFEELGEILKTAPPDAARMCIVTCADPRLDPSKFLSLPSHPDITTIIVRNAGGSPKKALVDILAIDTLVSFTDILIVRHTDCGTTVFRDDSIKQVLRDRVAGIGRQDLDGHLDQMTFGDCPVSAEQRCSEDVEWLREHPLVREDLRKSVRGGVLDLKSGVVKMIE